MKLQLNRPLAAFDFETTGKQPTICRAIEMGIIMLYPDGTQHSIKFLFNPGEPIPAEASAIHGFTDDMVKDFPSFKDKATEIAEILTGCDFLTFNGNQFDIPLLAAEFDRSGVTFNFSEVEFIDAGTLFKIMAPRTLSNAVRTYLNKELDGAHGALVDTLATVEVLTAMIEAHGNEMPTTVGELALKSNYGNKRIDLEGKFVYNSLGIAVFTFGKHKDQPVFKELSYLDWMLSAKNDDGTYKFSHDTRNWCGIFKKGDKSTMPTDGFKPGVAKQSFNRI